jgi:hypothetical protein
VAEFVEESRVQGGGPPPITITSGSGAEEFEIIGLCTRAEISPFASTTQAATFVPPMSTPTNQFPSRLSSFHIGHGNYGAIQAGITGLEPLNA